MFLASFVIFNDSNQEFLLNHETAYVFLRYINDAYTNVPISIAQIQKVRNSQWKLS